MIFLKLSEYLEKLEATSSRLEITGILSDLFKEASLEDIDKITYLVLGLLAPGYKGIVFNMADKLVIQAIAKAFKVNDTDVNRMYKTNGDLGTVAESFAGIEKQKNRKIPSFAKALKDNGKREVVEIYDTLLTIAQDEGEGSVDRKIEKMAILLSDVDPLSARYLARIPIGKLRLGFSDKTIIDALSWMETGGKNKSKIISEAFNILPDVGLLAKDIKEKGIDGACKNVQPVVGVPILPMLAQRLKSPAEMIEKMGEVFVEPKFDGLRVLIHYKKINTNKYQFQINTNSQLNKQKNLKTEKLKKEENIEGRNGETKVLIKAFTRNSNDVTSMFPEIQRLGEFINADSAIFDSEAVGMDPGMKKLLDFQTTMQRRRIHKIEETSKNIPLRFQVFDILYMNGESFINVPYEERRKVVEELFSENNLFVVAQKVRTKNPEVIISEYQRRIKEGLEGVMIKKVDAEYISGRTGWRWVKMKQEEAAEGKLSDTVDAVVMGYTTGKGKRAGFGIGQFLVGVKDGEKIKTICKVGTGLTDDQFRGLAIHLKKLEVKEKPKEYEAHKNYTPDHWVEPKLIVELAGDDLTVSPTHTSGYALRFPRMVNLRNDKSPNEATTTEEIHTLYKLQGK